MSKIELLKNDIETQVAFISGPVHHLAAEDPSPVTRQLSVALDSYLLAQQEARDTARRERQMM